MAKKRIPGTKALFEETEAVAEALVRQPDHLAQDIPVAQLVPLRQIRIKQVKRLDAVGPLGQPMQRGAAPDRQVAGHRFVVAQVVRRRRVHGRTDGVDRRVTLVR